MTTDTSTQTDSQGTQEARREYKRAWREAQKDKRTTGEYIGFVGCAKLGVLKVRVYSREQHAMEVACTCGEVHMTTDPLIRQRLPGEVVTLIEEGAPMTVGDDDAPAPRKPSKPPTAPKSDADVLAAIPDDWTAASEVAEALGYPNPGSLTNRLRQMRQRGADIEARQKHRGAPLYVRRTVTP